MKGIPPFVATVCHALTGLGPLEIRDVDQVAMWRDRARTFIEGLEEERTRAANVVARYVQNSEVRASGQIVLQRGACYYSDLFAGNGVIMRSGVFRGEAIRVDVGDVVLDEVGSPAGTKVRIEIVTRGRFTARLVHPGVMVAIGGQSHVFEAPARYAEVRLDGASLSVLQGRGACG